MDEARAARLRELAQAELKAATLSLSRFLAAEMLAAPHCATLASESREPVTDAGECFFTASGRMEGGLVELKLTLHRRGKGV